MNARIRVLLSVAVFVAATTLFDLPAQAARPLPRRPYYSAYSTWGYPIYSEAGYPIQYWYGFAPYVYYETYGFGGIQGAPNASPLQYGTDGVSFGSSGYSLDASYGGF